MMSVRHNSPLAEACTDFVRANLKEAIKIKDWAEVTKDAFMASLIALEKVTMTMVPAQIQAPSERGTSDQFYFGQTTCMYFDRRSKQPINSRCLGEQKLYIII